MHTELQQLHRATCRPHIMCFVQQGLRRSPATVRAQQRTVNPDLLSPQAGCHPGHSVPSDFCSPSGFQLVRCKRLYMVQHLATESGALTSFPLRRSEKMATANSIDVQCE